eukprot:CAMPEP_0183745294 /NCGR_PEP_ID=MMETSP0737-20130205/66164_1 /TAXON_ID=385413 /ORGANISM="Thalassiosira miniscula, Strain CCMP1093" /LENGTH=237 /DNA_ID=CAMNT_0025980951 /DNA_START=78 /DNA_END=791 /DNA_ORIENTATION=-
MATNTMAVLMHHHGGRHIDNSACHIPRRLFCTTNNLLQQTHDGCRNDNFDKDDLISVEVEEANARHLGRLQIQRVNDSQWGVFSSQSFSKGSKVLSSKRQPLLSLDKYNKQQSTNDNYHQNAISPSSNSHLIQIDWNQHIFMDLPARFLNHSCDPNIGVGGELNADGSYDFVALRDIEVSEEVCFDYETTEYEVGAFSECLCGATNCRGSIRGYKHNSNAIQAKYGVGRNVAGYLLR